MSILVQYKNNDKDNININYQNKNSSNNILGKNDNEYYKQFKTRNKWIIKNQIPKGWSGDVVPNGFALEMIKLNLT